MNDDQFQAMVQAAQDIQYLIIKAGGMATKSKVEVALMARFNIDRGEAHSIMNYIEYKNERIWRGRPGGIVWVAKRPEPRIEDYQELICHSK